MSSRSARTGAFELVERAGVTFVVHEELLAVPGLAHAFSTRLATGDAGFDLGSAEDRSASVAARRKRFLAAAGFDSGAVPVVLKQVHGARVIPAARWTEPPEADGAVWRRDGDGAATPCVRTADCVPLILAGRTGATAAVVHAGWRGTVARIATAAVEALAASGVSPTHVVAVLGPAILGCCYEVGPEVAEAILTSGGASAVASAPGGSGKSLVDLHEANASQLLEAGVPSSSIHRAPWCTRCRNDLFPSFRLERERAGRMMAAVGQAVRP